MGCAATDTLQTPLQIARPMQLTEEAFRSLQPLRKNVPGAKPVQKKEPDSPSERSRDTSTIVASLPKLQLLKTDSGSAPQTKPNSGQHQIESDVNREVQSNASRAQLDLTVKPNLSVVEEKTEDFVYLQQTAKEPPKVRAELFSSPSIMGEDDFQNTYLRKIQESRVSSQRVVVPAPKQKEDIFKVDISRFRSANAYGK